ncbi:MAG: C69 family dipeptidase [Bacilli bacterium]|nr:C69 family dipeptidase [Bacilli bacterium]
MNIKKLLIVPVTLLTLMLGCSLINNEDNTVKVNANEDISLLNNINLDNEEDLTDTFDSCSIMYVGKNVAKDGRTIIARTADGATPLIYHNTKVYERNAFKDAIIYGINGFSWQMPSTTYRYIGFPRSHSVGVSYYWDVSTMNENGVAISATLSCFANPNTVLQYDPFVVTGISEDNIAGLLAATSQTARGAIEYLANVIDVCGSAEANAIMAIDQQEAWYMELYTGHQYCAVKCPDDKVTTIGNEFLLNTLVEYNDEDIITSPNLFTLPKEKGLAVYEGGSSDKNMHLFYTYARPLSYTNLTERMTVDASHMRTWRGINLFAKNEEKCDYVTDKKLPSWFTPAHKLANEDVFRYFRDRFEDILLDSDPKYDIFRENLSYNKLRYVGVENSYQTHIIKVHPNLPKSLAVEAWISFGASIGSPFVPFNNAMTDFPLEYTHEVKNYGPDEISAQYIYRRISAIGLVQPLMYLKPVQSFWSIWEDIWNKQYSSCLIKAAQLIQNNQTSAASYYLNEVLYNMQLEALFEARYLFNDLLTRYMIDQKSYNPNPQLFIPKTNIIKLARIYGYTYSYTDTSITLTYGNEDRVIQITNISGINGQQATIQAGPLSTKMDIHIQAGEVYGDAFILNEFIASGLLPAEIIYVPFTIDVDPALPLVFLIPSIIILVGVVVIIIITVVKVKKSK